MSADYDSSVSANISRLYLTSIDLKRADSEKSYFVKLFSSDADKVELEKEVEKLFTQLSFNQENHTSFIEKSFKHNIKQEDLIKLTVVIGYVKPHFIKNFDEIAEKYTFISKQLSQFDESSSVYSNKLAIVFLS
jgi:hypothetical protein